MGRPIAQIDTTIEIVTPENIAFRHRLAGPFRRLPAYLIDLTIRAFVAGVGFLGLRVLFGYLGMPGLGIAVGFVIWFLLAFFYGGFFEAYWNGQTPGKRITRIRVVTVDGQPISGLQAVLRNVLRTLDLLPPVPGLWFMGFYQVGFWAAVMNDRFQRLGDLVCGTMVVVEERPWHQGVAQLVEPEAARMAALLPPGFRPSRTLARALAAYVRRRPYFTWGRRFEIARHVAEPLRQQFGLPANTNPDLLLCGLYHRVFLAEGENGATAAQASPRRPRAERVDPRTVEIQV